MSTKKRRDPAKIVATQVEAYAFPVLDTSKPAFAHLSSSNYEYRAGRPVALASSVRDYPNHLR